MLTMADSYIAERNFRSLKLCFVNCQSLYAHFDEFVHFFRNGNCQIICMSETWLRPMISDDMVKLPGYALHRCDRLNKIGGGVAFYLSNSLNAKTLKSSAASDFRKPEFIISEISFKNTAKLLLAVYRPPNSGYLHEFQHFFLDLQINYKHTIIVGDFNIDMASNTYDSD